MFCNHIANVQRIVVKLLSYILLLEFNEYFDLTDVKEEERGVEKILHLYLHRRTFGRMVTQSCLPTVSTESCINHFPQRALPFCTYAARWKDGLGDRIARLGVDSKRNTHTKSLPSFFKRIPWIHPRLQPDHSENRITSRLTSSNVSKKKDFSAGYRLERIKMHETGLSSIRT